MQPQHCSCKYNIGHSSTLLLMQLFPRDIGTVTGFVDLKENMQLLGIDTLLPIVMNIPMNMVCT